MAIAKARRLFMIYLYNYIEFVKINIKKTDNYKVILYETLAMTCDTITTTVKPQRNVKEILCPSPRSKQPPHQFLVKSVQLFLSYK